jgi:hypothetical protein
MLTLSELQASTINPAVAREAYTQVDRHLVDLLDVRKSFEQKAATLMGAYITLSVALFGIGGALFKDSSAWTKVLPFFGAGLIFVIGAWCFIVALKSGQYAALGSTPEMWLNRGTIDGEDNAVSAMLAYLTFHHGERIAICLRGNKRKARWIDAGIFLGPLAPIVFLVIYWLL